MVAWAGGGDALCETGFVLQQCNKTVVFDIGWFCGRLWWLLYGETVVSVCLVAQQVVRHGDLVGRPCR